MRNAGSSTKSSTAAGKPVRTGRGTKPHVPSACTNCKKAHLACDLQRPCRRCVNVGKTDTCKDVQHKKRGRPRSKDKKAAAGNSEKSLMENQMFQFSFAPSSTATECSSNVPQSLSSTSDSTLVVTPKITAAVSVTPPPSPSSTATTTTTRPTKSAIQFATSSPSLSSTISASRSSVVALAAHGPNSLTRPHSPYSVLPEQATPVSDFRGHHVVQSPQPSPYLMQPNSSLENKPSLTLPVQQEHALQFVPTSTIDKAQMEECCSYLFLTPSLSCLRLEESTSKSGHPLLGHSLLSLVNRSLMDFVSPHDKPKVYNTFEAMRQSLSARVPLSKVPSRVYSHTAFAHSYEVDPNTFQTISVERLLQRPAFTDIVGRTRSHIRTSTGCYDLFDLHIYIGVAGERMPADESSISLDQIYFVCRISKFDALTYAPRLNSTLLPRIALTGPFTHNPEALHPTEEFSAAGELYGRTGKSLHTNHSSSSDALYLLATVTDGDATAAAIAISKSKSAEQLPTSLAITSTSTSTTTSSPVFTTPSPSLSASPKMVGLPPLSDLLKSVDGYASQQQPVATVSSSYPSLYRTSI